MERSSDRSCRQRLGEDTGQVHSRRAGVFPAISTGTRWSLLLPVEAQDRQLRLGAQGAKMLLDADSKVLVAAAKQMLDSTDEELLYATASERSERSLQKQSKAKEEGDRKQRIQQWQQQSGCDRHRPHVGTAQKELARQWYAKESRRKG